MNLTTTIMSNIDTLLNQGVASNSAAVAQAISPVFIAAIGLYVAVKIFQLSFLPNSDVIMKEVIVTIVQLSAVSAFTYSAPYYSQYVIPFVMHSGQDLSNAITGTSDAANSIDSTWKMIATTMDEYWKTVRQSTDLLDIGSLISAYAVYIIGYIGGFILMLYSTMFLCVAQFAVGILLSAGILFICFSVFPSTRSMFTAWCGCCLNYIILNLFFTISLSFVTSFIGTLTTQITPENLGLYTVLTILAVVLICVFLIEQIGTMCSTLTGGVGINGLTAAANGVGGKALGLAARASGLRPFMQAIGRGVGGVAKKTAQNTGSRIQQMASRGQKIKGA